jgi:dTDP-4-dehydrorhamnose reductase
MKTHMLTGSRSEIADALARIEGEIREVVVVEEPLDSTVPATVEDMFAEMEPYMVNVEHFDDSREAIYTRMEGE